MEFAHQKMELDSNLNESDSAEEKGERWVTSWSFVDRLIDQTIDTVDDIPQVLQGVWSKQLEFFLHDLIGGAWGIKATVQANGEDCLLGNISWWGVIFLSWGGAIRW
jgi:hypothetical protein